ncbi:MAG TPA: lipocalin family protein [Gemmatimonadaceae bacterium]|nr:lipocalin family protein [Gemmatimonadaceae bacterium]
MRALLLACLATLTVVACSDGPTAVDHSGTYHLVSINEIEPPILWNDSPELRTVITGGVIVLRRDNSFEDRLDATLEVDPPSEPVPWARPSFGTWTVEGQTLSMTYTNGQTHPAQLSDGRITQTLDDLRYVYQK